MSSAIDQAREKLITEICLYKSNASIAIRGGIPKAIDALIEAVRQSTLLASEDAGPAKSVAQRLEDQRMGHVRLDECSGCGPGSLYDRISFVLQRAANERSELQHKLRLVDAFVAALNSEDAGQQREPDAYGHSRSTNKRLEVMGKPLPAGMVLNDAKDLVAEAVPQVKMERTPHPGMDEVDPDYGLNAPVEIVAEAAVQPEDEYPRAGKHGCLCCRDGGCADGCSCNAKFESEAIPQTVEHERKVLLGMMDGWELYESGWQAIVKQIHALIEAVRLSALSQQEQTTEISRATLESRFAELISTELDHYAQKIAKSVLRKALGGKIAERE